MKYYGYIYKTKNLINNKIYIGQKKGQFNFDYYGSGLIIKQAIKKEGTKNFTLELLAYGLTKKQTDKLERSYISKYRNLFGINNIYNITDGGDGGDNFTNHPYREIIREKLKNIIKSSGWHHSSETKTKMKCAKLGKSQPIEHILKRIESRRKNGKVWHTLLSKKRISESETGKIVSKETRIKLKISSKKRWDNAIESEQTRLKRKISQRKRRFREKIILC